MSEATAPTVPIDTLVAALKTLQPRKKMTTDEYNRREAAKNPKPALNGTFFQNGIEVFEHQLTATAIAKINKLKAGIYCNEEFTVTTSKHGAAHRAVNIAYDMQPAARMNRQGRYQSLDMILDAILAEQTAVKSK